jgi:hypothetical protein
MFCFSLSSNSDETFSALIANSQINVLFCSGAQDWDWEFGAFSQLFSVFLEAKFL